MQAGREPRRGKGVTAHIGGSMLSQRSRGATAPKRQGGDSPEEAGGRRPRRGRGVTAPHRGPHAVPKRAGGDGLEEARGR
eukprot:873836-Prymnesium_polylepis.1